MTRPEQQSGGQVDGGVEDLRESLRRIVRQTEKLTNDGCEDCYLAACLANGALARSEYAATKIDARAATGPYVERLIRIFRDKPHDDTSALVLIDFANASNAELESKRAALERVEAVLREFEGMTGAGYRYMAANIRAAIAGAKP